MNSFDGIWIRWRGEALGDAGVFVVLNLFVCVGLKPPASSGESNDDDRQQPEEFLFHQGKLVV